MLRLLLWTSILTAALRSPKPLRTFLWIELFSTVSTDMAYWHYGQSRSYTVAYAIFHVIYTLAVLWLARPRLKALFFALLVAFLATFQAGWHFTPEIGVTLAEGFVFVLAGVSMALTGCKRQYAVLAILWLAMGAFDLCFVGQMKLAEWLALNEWWPPLLATVAFLWISCLQPPRLAHR